MNRLHALAWLVAITALSFGTDAQAQQRAQYEALVATHAKANLVPETLVHRVIVRESKYQPNLLGRGGAIGLMQIKLPTARSLGYTGDAAGLRDPETNLIYGIKYLAGAFRAAGGDHDRAVHYYASGYYYAAKQQRLTHLKQARSVMASAPPKELAKPAEAAKTPTDAGTEQVPAAQAGADGAKPR
jgi:soluble lytic murein transglycosylase-like protein